MCLSCRQKSRKQQREYSLRMKGGRRRSYGTHPSSDAEDDDVENFLSGKQLFATESTPAPEPAPEPVTEPAHEPIITPEAELEPEIVEIKPAPDLRFPPASHPQDEVRLREAVLALAAPDMDAHSVVLIVDYLRRYFTPLIGRKPSALQREIARTLLANPRVDEELRVILRPFYNVLWMPVRCKQDVRCRVRTAHADTELCGPHSSSHY
jgi:hypothetical protein